MARNTRIRSIAFLFTLIGLPASAADISAELKIWQQSKDQEGFVSFFAQTAHSGDADALMKMIAPSLQSRVGPDKIRAAVVGQLIPFFAKYEKIHGYKGINSATLPDGSAGTAYYTYIVDGTDVPKPFIFVVVDEAGSHFIGYFEVNKCVPGRHPFCN